MTARKNDSSQCLGGIAYDLIGSMLWTAIPVLVTVTFDIGYILLTSMSL